ncbi:unnamed protein product [Effrenium voratum]|nr:unnamed protein product [Effrenium voratum]
MHGVAERQVEGGIDEWLEKWCTDQVLESFQHASSKESGMNSLATALNWRKKYRAVLTGAKTPCWQGDMRVVARADSGHPVIFMSMLHQPSSASSASTVEHMAAVLEAACEAAIGGAWGFVVVCDCRGFQLSKNLDPRPAIAAMEVCAACILAASGPMICSPCRVPVVGQEGLQRVCTTCAAKASKLTNVTEQLSFLARQLADLANRPAEMTPATLEAALGCCESCVEPLRKERLKHKIVERRCREAEEELATVQKELDSLRARRSEREGPGPRTTSQDSESGGYRDADESSCWICSSRLGKRFLNPRHHCRICDRPVCGQCSPSSVTLEGRSTTQRACSLCVKNAEKAPALSLRLQSLAGGLAELALGKLSGGHQECLANSLEDAVRQCELRFAMLKEMQTT